MKITVVGCGNAFSERNFNQSFLLEETWDGKTRKLLIDCGSEVPNALKKAGVKIMEIDDIYISHLHADHIGGLERFAFIRYDWMNKPRKADSPMSKSPTLVANKQLINDIWEKSLRGGLESMEGFVATIETFFKIQAVEPNRSFDWQGWTVRLIQQIHIMSGSIIMPSFGLIFSKQGHKSVYFVTDSQHCSPRQIEDFYKEADMIFQDCELTGVNLKFFEGEQVYKDEDTWKLWPSDKIDLEGNIRLELSVKGINPEPWECSKGMSGVHANYAQLAGYSSANSIKLPKEIKAKMWLSHYQDFIDSGDGYGNHNVDWYKLARDDGFAGFVQVGQLFTI